MNIRVDRERIISEAEKDKEFVQFEDGSWYWWPFGCGRCGNKGAFASHYLRWLADELDKRNGPSDSIRVRMAVAVTEKGDWSCAGWRDNGVLCSDKDSAEEAQDRSYDAGGTQIRWVEADITGWITPPSVSEGRETA